VKFSLHTMAEPAGDPSTFPQQERVHIRAGQEG
jgi:hypothetical protein